MVVVLLLPFSAKILIWRYQCGQGVYTYFDAELCNQFLKLNSSQLSEIWAGGECFSKILCDQQRYLPD